MRHDMITVFNQLTSKELADCNIFKELLDYHFFKFKYFYSLIKGLSLNKIDNISCETQPKNIILCITPHENSYINEIITTINKKKKKNSMTKYFNMNLIESDSKIYIDISLSELDEEDGLYEN